MMTQVSMADNTFYFCTELSPRCFVVQKAIQIDHGQLNRVVGDFEKPTTGTVPPTPILPPWFTVEVREALITGQHPALQIAPQIVRSPSPNTPVLDVKQQLKQRLEYYFSRENLLTDKYLGCQMDSEQYVPVSVVSSFRKIVELSTDQNLILEILRESNAVELDAREEKVRPVCRRCTIIIREISEMYRQEVEEMLSKGPPYVDLRFCRNNSWYVSYANEEITQEAYLKLQALDFNERPICARIKTGRPPSDLPPSDRGPTQSPDVELFAANNGMLDIGQLLLSHGYVPYACYKPEITTYLEEQDQEFSRKNSFQRNVHSPRGRSIMNGAYGMPAHTFQNGTTERPNTTRRDGRREPRIQNGMRNDVRKERTHHGRRNGGGGNSSHNDNRRYFNNSPNVPMLSVSTGDLSTETPTQVERPRYNSFRKASHTDDSSGDHLSVSSCKRRWEIENETVNERKTGAPQKVFSRYSFEEMAFPSLTEPKPEPEKPAEKPSFSCVAAGKRYAKPEPKKSYAEKLKERPTALHKTSSASAN